MRKGFLSGWGKVFRFSLSRTVSGKGWKLLTLIPALLLLLCIPALVILLQDRGGEEEAWDRTALRVVYVADETPGELDFRALNGLGDPVYSGLDYVVCVGPEDALARTAGEPDSLILSLRREGDGYRLRVVLPEQSALDMGEAEHYAEFLNGYFGAILPLKSGLTPEQLAEVLEPVQTSTAQAAEILSGEESGDGAAGEIREIADIILPYLNVMLLYFLVLFYGQGVASSVVLEKQSKLMDTFLLSLRPEAMILGKLLAGTLAGILQVLAWIAGAAGGVLLTSGLMHVLYPDAQMGFLLLLKQLGALGFFAPGPSILALLIIVGGFLLYCSLAAVGGALAGKQADLGSTNSLFTTLLVASFLISILGKGSSSGQIISDASWMNYVPFTAVLTLPSRLVLGEASALTGIVSLVIVLLFALAIAMLAGRLYTLLAFRKGDPPKIKEIPALLRGK